ncbi:hypothetical protein [Urbifossiella limnaea]|uniref:Uncharacterized protein n=1 Tax=Urbifossiella limnaea TaxID=2528023 RepID=A0A517Y0U7_9BACT|nr:hypothetical protein [Urbifossiella limnaea]QDU23377.1 hypothetical protein ETAA1_53760 [Urbifossiella limnaea]
MSRLAEAVDLIGSPRQVNAENTPACVGLMKEFLRREALWANELDLAGEVPFADLAARAEGGASLEAQYQEMLDTFTYSEAEYRCCLAMLNWYGHSVLSLAVAPPGADDPYLPLLHFFRLGGTFRREHRVFIDINSRETIHSATIQKGDLATAIVSLDG